jgi:hypothetical protein
MEVGFYSFKIMKYRLYLVLIINVLILSWLIYLGYTAEVTDVLGLFQFIVFIFLFIYDIYFLVINKLFFKNTRKRIIIEVIFIVLLLLPFLVLWYLTY